MTAAINGRRPLGETLSDIAGGALGIGAAAGTLVRVTSIDLDLPLDIRLADGPEGPVVVGDVPLFRTRTAFDTEPSRLIVHCRAADVEALP